MGGVGAQSVFKCYRQKHSCAHSFLLSARDISHSLSLFVRLVIRLVFRQEKQHETHVIRLAHNVSSSIKTAINGWLEEANEGASERALEVVP